MICRRCADPRPTFLYYEDFRAHLRVVHQRRDFDRNDLILFESWPGSSRYILNRERTSVRRNPRNEAASSGQIGLNMSEVVGLISNSVADGIARGIASVMETVATRHGNSLFLSIPYIVLMFF